MVGIVKSMITCVSGVLRDIGGITFRLVLEGVVIFSASPLLLLSGRIPSPLNLSWVGHIEGLSLCVDHLWRNFMVSLSQGVSLQGLLSPT